MTPLFQKLNYKHPLAIYVFNAPEYFNIALKPMRDCSTIKDPINISEVIDFTLIFVSSKMEIEYYIQNLYPFLHDETILWFCYPKRTSKKYKSELNRDKGWEILGKYDYESVRQIAIDEDWSALRFKKSYLVQKMIRRESFALSENGKKRVSTLKNTMPNQNENPNSN